MHILLSSDELKKLDTSVLPEGTTVVESNGKKYIKSYIVKSDALEVVRDFVEEDRPWKKGEMEAFIKGKGKAAVLDYFLKYDDTGPHREFVAMCNLEDEKLSFIGHDGTYRYLDDDTKYNIFRISINRDSNLDKAEKELSWALNRIAAFYENVPEIEIKILDHTLSEYGSFDFLWDKEDTFTLRKTTYGHTDTLGEFGSLRELIEDIAENHYYK